MKTFSRMKFILMSLTFVFGLAAQAQLQDDMSFEAANLDGKTFCRTVNTGGLFGQPKGQRQHCVSFNNGKMTDNANTFFGNPPETEAYKLTSSSDVVVVRKKKQIIVYSYVNNTLVNSVGTVLTLAK